MRSIGKYFWRFMIIFSFVFNVILILTLFVLMLVIFTSNKISLNR